MLSTALFYYNADCHSAEHRDGMSVDVLLISAHAETVTGDIFVHNKLLSHAPKYISTLWADLIKLFTIVT